MPEPLPAWAQAQDEWLLLRIKVVPGAARTRIAGPLGDHLKVQVAAPPTAGRANAALIACLADWLGIPPRDIRITSGHNQARKCLHIPDMPLPVPSDH